MKYDRYYLIDNPFPKEAIIDPFSDDKRVNGQIFNEELRQIHVNELKKRINERVNIIYVRALTFEKGIGKSALMCYVWRELQKRHEFATAFLKSTSKDTPDIIASNTIKSFHNDGYLWKALKKCAFKYAESPEAQSIISRTALENLLRSETMPQKIDLASYVFPPKTLTESFTEWLCRQIRMNYEVINRFVSTYLSFPFHFLKQYDKLRYDPIDELFKSMINFMHFSGFYCYVFIDQFEYIVGPLERSRKELARFCNEMRRLLEASTGKVTYIVSLHSEAHAILTRYAECHYFRSVANPDTIRMIPDLERLGPDEAVKLAVTYMNHFRGEFKPPSPYFPFDKNSIYYICESRKGIPRFILEALYKAIEVGIKYDAPSIDINFIKGHEKEILPE